MPPITALLHTANDALRLGRALETLLPCDEILIVDHDSADATRHIAREYGARIVAAADHARASHYLDLARNDWIFCMVPSESLTESLQASLFEWSATPPQTVAGAPPFSICIRQQVGDAWQDFPVLETRLIPRGWNRWSGRLPAHEPSAIALQGELLLFFFP
jgi:hypothetical protein